jgi:hypothetical protein
MYWQKAYVRENITFTRNQTYKVDLPETGILDHLMLKLTANCTSGYSLAVEFWRLMDFLTTVEVIGNGSTIIKSLTFKHLHFLNHLRLSVPPPAFWRNYAENTQMEYVTIPFGRWLKDSLYGLDLSRWNNVELRITNTATAASYSTDITMSIMACFRRDDLTPPLGYLKHELWRQWTTVQDQIVYLTLPTEHPISGIYLRALPHTTSGMSDTGFANLMDDIDFSLMGGTKQVYKGGLDDLIVENRMESGLEVITSGQADKNADTGFDAGIGRMMGWASVLGSKDAGAGTIIETMIADATDNTISYENREADHPHEFIARGLAYMNMAYLHHVKDLNADQLIDPKRDGEVLLNIHTRNAAASAAGVNDVVLERVVTG